MDRRVWGIIGGVALLVALFSPLLLNTSKKVEKAFERAETLYEKAEYPAALEKYTEVLTESENRDAKTDAIDPDFTTLVNMRIATCEAKLAEQSGDISHYEKALEHIEKGELTVKTLEYQEELNSLREFVERGLDKNKQSDGNQTDVQQPELVPDWTNDLSKFQAFYKEKNRRIIVPNRPQVAKTEEAIDKAEKAVKHLQRLDCKAPSVSDAEKYLADARQEQENGAYDDAIQLANKAEELAKSIAREEAERYVNAGYSRLQSGELDRAKANAEAAHRYHPSYPKISELLNDIKQAYYQLGRAYLKDGEFACALACAEKALAIDPNYKEAIELKNSIDIEGLKDECEDDIP